MHGLVSFRRFGRARSLRNDRALARARSLRSDRAGRALGCYVATERVAFSHCITTCFELLSDVSFFPPQSFLLAPQLVRVVTLAGGLMILKGLSVLDEVHTINSAEKKLSRQYVCYELRTYTSISSELLSFTFFTPSLLHTFKNLSSSKTFAFNMSSSQGDKRDSDVEMGEATSPAPVLTSPAEAPACVAGHLSFREKLVRRQAEKELVQAGSEFPSSSARVVAPGHVIEVMAPLSKEIVLALRAPSAVPVESTSVGRSLVTGRLRIKFMSLIDGMISECGSETSCLAGELVELQGRWSETEDMQTTVKDSHSAKVPKLEVAVGELERDLGKTASSLLKEKKARKVKSSEVRWLQRQIQGDAGLASRGIQEATDALHAEFQACLAKISASLGSLECIRNMDLALATIEGGMAVVRSFQSETPPTLEVEEARLSGCKGDMAAVDGDFVLILANLKSACFLPTCSEDPEGKDTVVGENGGDAAPGSDEETGEEGE
ncbi:hypothetical protein F2Q68_00015477 [Brassica cretica]|uniref:Uncharacterized protein n=1 Tax=Brassica cretica TaxID=69181 RepID=A0A8S9HD62_BRACR|nr:hypothetical protein F2Q68_00015477 [Brassica cretica]